MELSGGAQLKLNGVPRYTRPLNMRTRLLTLVLLPADLLQCSLVVLLYLFISRVFAVYHLFQYYDIVVWRCVFVHELASFALVNIIC